MANPAIALLVLLLSPAVAARDNATDELAALAARYGTDKRRDKHRFVDVYGPHLWQRDTRRRRIMC